MNSFSWKNIIIYPMDFPIGWAKQCRMGCTCFDWSRNWWDFEFKQSQKKSLMIFWIN